MIQFQTPLLHFLGGIIDMSENQNLLKKFYSGVLDLKLILDPDVSWEILDGFPFGGTYIGIKAVLNDFFPRLLEKFDDWHALPEEFFEVDDNVIVTGRYAGIVKSTRNKVDVPFVHIWTIKNAKATRMRQFTDTAKIHEAIEKQRGNVS